MYLTKLEEKERIKKKMKFIKKTIFFTVFSAFLAQSVSAQTIVPPVSGNIATLIQGIWEYLYHISFSIAILMIIVAGFMFVTASGNDAQLKKAKDLLLYTLIGFLTIILASGVVKLIQDQF
jgi:hypothetical protein